jgi:undecaprenyl-diphosphatase
MLGSLQAAFLGVVQGLTEFLPVSSSGHLVLAQNLLGLKEPELLFDVAVHVGTLLAVLVVFRADIYAMLRGLWARDSEARQGRRLLLLVVAGSVPTALIGLIFKDTFEALFASTLAVGLALLVTGLLLTATRFAPRAMRGLEQTGWGRAVIIGLAQGLAITPGISRSGATISAGLLLGLERELTARFSFVLSIPAILGALALQIKDLGPAAGTPATPLLVGAVVAAITGYAALKVLIKLVKGGRLHWFAYYCWALGLTALAWSLWGA